MPTKRRITFVGWVTVNEVAIAAGFLFPTLVMVNAIANGWEPFATFLVVVLGGGAQGFLVGFAQWALLARAGVTPPLLGWVAFVTAGTALAWAVVQIPGLLARETPPSVVSSITVATLVVAVALPMLAQWLVLRRVSTRAAIFAVISFGSWLSGAAILAATQAVLSSVTDLRATIAILVCGAFVAVFAVAVGTWLAASRLTQKRPAKN